MRDSIFLFALAATTVVSGCGLTRSTTVPDPAAARPAAGAPTAFEAAPPQARVLPGDTLPGSGCLVRLVDPDTGVALRLVRSNASIGDYRVPDDRFGVGEDELLQVECNTGRTRGIVPR